MKYRKKNKQAFTLLELIVAISISTVIMISVVTFMLISAKYIKEIYGPSRARLVRTNILNQIHFLVCDARVGSTSVSDNGNRLRFIDPNNAQNGVDVTSEFFFDANADPAERHFYFQRDITEDATRRIIARAPIPVNISFQLGSREVDPNKQLYLGKDTLVTVMVKTVAEYSYADVDTRDGETVFYLRNQ